MSIPDPAWCPTRSVGEWIYLKSLIDSWLTTPASIVLMITAFVILSWKIPAISKHWKRRLSFLSIIVLAIYLIASFPLTTAIANKGLVFLTPGDSGRMADAIVVLGRGEEFIDTRVKVAAKLWQEHRAPLIFASGAIDAPNMLKHLRLEGVPKQVLKEENCSRTTYENALFTAKVLQPQVKRIILITDYPHMLRSLLTFRNVGFDVIPHMSSLPLNIAPQNKTKMVFYEYIGLISYGLRGRFFRYAPDKNESIVSIGNNETVVNKQ
jgi:uncharacterized SAM-binding protein YcdF (DUF218 family)